LSQGTQAESEQSIIDRVSKGAIDAINPQSVKDGYEYGGLTYETANGDIRATPPVTDRKYDSVDTSGAKKFLPRGATILADWHTHGADSAHFSRGDVKGINAVGLQNPSYQGGYVGGADGRVFFYRANAIGNPITYERIGLVQRRIW
jgi:hypothetical protein